MSDAKPVTIGLPLFLSLLIASGSAGILKGPVTYPENGHDYYLLEQSTWLEALRESQRLDGHLATFTSEQEAQWVYETFGHFNESPRLLWIGLTDAFHEGKFAWITGEPVEYTDWAPGEPNGDEQENFVAMYYPGHDAQSEWNDWPDIDSDPIGLPFHGVVEIGGAKTHMTSAENTLERFTGPEWRYAQQSVPALPAGVELTSDAGKRYVGEQLKFFHVDPKGQITTSEPQWLYLYHTEGKRFRLRGEVWLGGKYESKELPFPSDLPHGFTLWLREWSGVKRYAANTDGLRVKRRLHEGKQQDGTTWPVQFDSLQTERWYRFYADVSRDFIYFHIGPKSGLIKGPLAVDGANKIVIAPRTQLRNLRLEVGEPLTGKKTTTSSESPSSSASTPQPDVIFVPTPQPAVDKMLEMAEIESGDLLYDLNCVDGRIVVRAAKKFGIEGVGVNSDAHFVKESRKNVREKGVEDLVTIKHADIFEIDFSDADVVTLYLLPSLNRKLKPKLATLQPGSRIISYNSDMDGAKPNQVYEHSGNDYSGKIYKWVVPWEKD